MDFARPPSSDLINVVSLNAAMLELIAADPAAIPCPAWLSQELAALDIDGRQRLSRTPVLLLSLSENDIERWVPVFKRRPERDLLAALDGPSLPVADLVTAALSFLWQLACRDAYAARVVSGGSVEWCEELGKTVLVDVLEFARREPGLAGLRHADSPVFWRRLLIAATAEESRVRSASRLAAMQAMLTGSASNDTERPMRAAACVLNSAAVVAERRRE